MMSRQMLATTIVGLGISLPVVAQLPSTPTTHERTKQLTEVAAQKVEADIRFALRESGRLGKTEPAQAINRLNEAIATLDADQSLTEQRKQMLTRILKDRLRVLQSGPESAAEEAARTEAEKQRQTNAKTIADKQAAETKTVKDSLSTISKLKSEGKTTEATRLINELAQKYPDNLAVQLLTSKTGFEKSINEAEKTAKDSDPRIVGALRDVDNSGNPNLKDVEFPNDWKTRTAVRKDVTAPTEDERKLLTALNTLVDARWRNSRFQDVMDHLQTVTNRTIIADAASLNDANVNYDTPVNFLARDQISLRTALRGVLSQLNLTFVVRDGIIHVTSPTKARDLMITRVYYLGDLIMGLGPYGGAPTLGVNLDQAQLVQNVTAIVGMITSAVDPQSWEGKGGQGHIGVNLPTLSLTVRQSQEVHVMLRSSLYGAKK